MTTKTSSARLLAFLKKGGNITAAQAQTKFGIANLSATVSNLRMNGYSIYLNRKTLASGNTISTYRMGTPTREVVAAGHRWLSAGPRGEAGFSLTA